MLAGHPPCWNWSRSAYLSYYRGRIPDNRCSAARPARFTSSSVIIPSRLPALAPSDLLLPVHRLDQTLEYTHHNTPSR